MGGSRYIKLDILLLCYVLIIMAPIVSVDLELSSYPVDEPCRSMKSLILNAPVRLFEYLKCSCVSYASDFQLLTINKLIGNKLINRHQGIPRSKMHSYFWSGETAGIDSRLSATDEDRNVISLKILMSRYLMLCQKVFGSCKILYVIILVVCILCCYVFEKTQDKETISLRNLHVLIKMPEAAACFTSMLNIKGEREISAFFSNGDKCNNYDWIFKFHGSKSPNVVSVYPGSWSGNLDRLATYSRFGNHKLPGFLSFSELSDAGFKFMGKDTEVQCVECKKLLSVINFTSSPAGGKYHEQGCRFIQAENYTELLVAIPDSSSVTPSLSSENLLFQEVEYNKDTSQIQTGKNGVKKSDDGFYDDDDIQVDSVPSTTTDVPSSRGSLYQNGETSMSPETLPGNGIVEQQFCGQDLNGKFDHEDLSESQAASAEGSNNCGTVQMQISQPSSTELQPTNQSVVSHVEELGATGQSDGVHAGSSSASGYSSSSRAEIDDSVDFEPEFEKSSKEVQTHRNKCTKNPGHYAYFSFGSLMLDYIPSNVRHPDVFRFLKTFAKLTVRVVVAAISKDRPKSDFLKHESKYRFGSGIAIPEPGAHYCIPNYEHPGKWNTIRNYLRHGRRHSYIYIETNRHLVYDDVEAQNTTVEFFYDHPSRRDVVYAKGISVCHSTELGDLKSVLICKTFDMSLVNMIKESRQEVEMMAMNFPQNIKEAMMKRVFLITHPHGAEKVFSYGEYVMVKYALQKENANGRTTTKMVKINNHTQISQNPEEIRKILLYTADTCGGSIGAVVISFKKTDTGDIVLDPWMHHGVDKKHGLNASVMRVLAPEDITNHGRPNTFSPSVQDDMNAEAERAANQVVSCPVFTVFRAPTHPAYVAYRKRLDSFPNPFNHVHTAVDLADAGFFFAGYADCVRCFQCGLGLRSWKHGDVINEEHFKNRPDCPFLQMKMRSTGIDTVGFHPHRQQNGEQNSAQSHAVSDVENGTNQNQQRRNEVPKLGMMEQQLETLQSTYPKESSATKYQHEIVHMPNPGNQNFTVGYVLQTSPPVGATGKRNRLNSGSSGSSGYSSDAQVEVGLDARRHSAVAILEREQHYLKQILICKVCFKNPSKDLFLPCGELVTCLDCSKLLTHCPSCNQKILATVTTYFS